MAPHERTGDRQCLVTSQVARDVTSELLTVANDAFRTRPQELMLAALVLAYREWSGECRLGVLLEGHGRSKICHQP